MNALKKIWSDPVWSKIIAVILIQIGIFIYGKIENIKFIKVYEKILTKDYTLSGWIFLLILILLAIAIFIIYRKTKVVFTNWYSHQNISKSLRKYKLATTIVKSLYDPEMEHPTVFFHNRFCDAFPGTEDGNIYWFESKKQIIERLSILLRSPVYSRYENNNNATQDPIWWFRGTSAMFIHEFKALSKSKILINIDELIINKMAAYRGRSYFSDYVYLECLPDKPTGLYFTDKEHIEDFFKTSGPYREEYGNYKGKLISRSEFDDGSAIFNGKPVKIDGASLRTRNLTKYNLIIAAKTSPYNNSEFEWTSEKILNEILITNTGHEELFELMKKLPKNRYD